MSTGWIDLCLRVEARDRKKAEGIASGFTRAGLYVEDYSDMAIMLPLVGGVDYIDESLSQKDKTAALIHVYLSEPEEAAEVSTRLSEALSEAGLDFSLEILRLEDEDWANGWKKFHPPQKHGRLVICPSWETYAPTGNELVLTLDPGDAFGSGRDETTRVCLRLLQERLSPGDRLLDIGCGSGVLALAALLLGAEMAVGVDIEQKAVRTALENAEINGLSHRFSAYLGNLVIDPKLDARLGGDYDLIAANIVADVHLAMGEAYLRKLKPGGQLVLSGIIEPRRDEVRGALEALGFLCTGQEEENGWTGLSFEKPSYKEGGEI